MPNIRLCWYWAPLLAVMLSGCQKSLDWSLPNESLKMERGGQTCTISPSSTQFKELSDWLAGNRGGWSSSPASYVPNVMLRGSNFSVNFVNSLVVVNYRGGQFTHDISPSDYAFLACNSGT